MNLNQIAARAAGTAGGTRGGRTIVPGLPSVRLPSNERRQRNVANTRLGATQTVLGTRAERADVVGQPSMTMRRRRGGGVVIELRRLSRSTELIPESALRELRRLLEMACSEARALSKGPLTLRMLAQRGNPYGRGRRQGLGRLQGARAGVSNLAVVNKQTGNLEASWGVELLRDKGGVTLRLINTAPEAEFVAFGTPAMRAHGPFTTALSKYLTAINREWARITRQAQAQMTGAL